MADTDEQLGDEMQRAGLSDYFGKKKDKKEGVVLPQKRTLKELGHPEKRHLSGNKCGLIINNNFKGKKGHELPGYDVDVVNIQQTFAGVNVKFETEENLTAKELIPKVQMWLKMNKHDLQEADSAFVFILTHGDDNGVLLGEDYGKVKLSDVKKLFLDCKELYGKPKLFFIQACRGTVDPEAVPTGIRTAAAKKLKAKDADFFQFFPTAPGHTSWVGNQGSLFIRTLCEVVHAYADQFTLQDIVTKVNQILAEEIKQIREGNKMTTVCEAPEVTHSLTYNLYLKAENTSV